MVINYATIVSNSAFSGISNSSSRISLAQIFSDSINSSWDFSWAFTPGKSTSQPIHQPSSCFTIALYSMLFYLMNGISKSLCAASSGHIFRARVSLISECLGMAVLLSSLPQNECRLPSRINLASFFRNHLIRAFLFTRKLMTKININYRKNSCTKIIQIIWLPLKSTRNFSTMRKMRTLLPKDLQAGILRINRMNMIDSEAMNDHAE